jgi:hypothetical protein
MRINKLYIALGVLIAFGLFFELAAHADEFNKETTVTFSAPVQIPGQVLPAGSYIFELGDPNSDQNLVRVFNADRSVVLATLQTVSADRREPTGDTAITLAETEGGQPEMLVKWFYPGELTGHEFVYSKQQEQQIAHAQKATFVGDRVMSNSEASGD